MSRVGFVCSLSFRGHGRHGRSIYKFQMRQGTSLSDWFFASLEIQEVFSAKDNQRLILDSKHKILRKPEACSIRSEIELRAWIQCSRTLLPNAVFAPAPTQKFGAMASNAKRSRRRHTEKGFRPYHSVSVPKSVDLVHSCSPTTATGTLHPSTPFESLCW